MGGHFDPTIFSKSNNFLFGFFCAPFFSIAEFVPFYHQLVHFWCSESHYFGIWGPCHVTNWRFLAFFEKRKKIGKNWKIDFSENFYPDQLQNTLLLVWVNFGAKIAKSSYFFKNKSVFQKIGHFDQNWRKWVMNSVENAVLVESSKCLYHVCRRKTGLFTLLSRLNSFVINIFLLITLFQCSVKMTPPHRGITFGKYP